MHVAPLIVCVLMARWHLLDRVDVDVDVRGRIRRVEHLAEGQNEAACGVLGKARNDNVSASREYHGGYYYGFMWCVKGCLYYYA